MHSFSDLSVRRGIVYIAIAATAWGTGGAVAAVLYDIGGLGPASVSFWRFLSGLLLLVAAHVVRRSRRPGKRGSLRRTVAGNTRRILITGFGLAVYQTAYFAAVQQAGLTVATVVTLGAGPVLVAVGARVTLDERIGVGGMLAVASSAVGLALLMGGADTSTGPDPLVGLGYALLSAVGYAGVTLLGRASGRKGEGGSFEATLAGFAVGTVCLLPVALLEGLLPSTDRLGWTVGLIGYLGGVPTALAYALFFAGLAVVRATTASVVALVEPLTAALVGIAFLDERLNPVVAVGAVLLLSAVFFLTASEPADRPAPREPSARDARAGDRGTAYPPGDHAGGTGPGVDDGLEVSRRGGGGARGRK